MSTTSRTVIDSAAVFAGGAHMPICQPEEPDFASPAERAVWSRLRDQLGDDDLLMTNVRLTDHDQDYELDLLVVMPGAGAVVIEVKGGTVRRFGDEWHQLGSDDRKGRRVRPIGQAERGKHALRKKIHESARWQRAGRRQLRWAHAVVLPDCRVDPDDERPDTPLWLVFDETQLDDLATRLRELLDSVTDDRRPADAADVEVVLDVLTDRGRSQRDFLALADQRSERLDIYTRDQVRFLDAACDQRRLEIRGGAGSGKTWLAAEQARRLAADGQDVALLCYSKGLSHYLKRLVDGSPDDQRPAYVGTFHAFGHSLGVEVPEDASSEWWESAFPAALMERAEATSEDQLFDAVVLDESQDFSYFWWQALLSLLRDRRGGGLYVFTDEGQRIFRRRGRPPDGLVSLRLSDNIRNTRQIAHVFAPLVPEVMRPCDVDGPPVRFVPIRGGRDPVLSADEQVEYLVDQGWRPRDIAVLTTGRSHPRQLSRGAQNWQDLWNGDEVFYGHVRGFKGLERRAVVLALNHARGQPQARELLYVGLSRARDHLTVCGTLANVAAAAGSEVARRLDGAA